jgi:hypothetical protein
MYAEKAALVTYHPEYAASPFLDDERLIRRVILHAVGVPIRGVPLTFKFVADCVSGRLEGFVQDVLDELSRGSPLVRGTIESPRLFEDALSVRP